MKKILSRSIACFITIITVLNFSILSFADETIDKVDLSSNYGVVIDYETGRILGGENIHSKIYPASTTKIWTAYLVIKNIDNLNEPIEIEEVPLVEASSLYLQKGEIFTVKQLIEGLLIHSANDAAEVLAKRVSGSIEEFAKLMTEEAKKAGALNTSFKNPHGLPNNDHYSTPYDMALLARTAMSEEIIREIVKQPSISFKITNTATSKINIDRYFLNKNKFLGSNSTMIYKDKQVPIKYDIVDGIKTGYTDTAGNCLLSSAVKNDMRVIAAVFKAIGTNVYVDSRTLLDYGFENYYSKTIVDKEEYTKTKRVLFSKEKELIYQPKASYKVTLKNGEIFDSSNYSYKEKLNYDLPIYKGDKVGTIEIYNNNKLEKTVDLVSTNEIHSTFSFITENKVFKIIFKIIKFLLLLTVIFFAFIILKKKYKRKFKKKKNNKK